MSLAETLEPYLDSSPSPLVALVGEQAHHAALMELAPGPPRESVRYLSADADTAAFDYCGGASGEQPTLILKRDWLHKHTHVVAAVVVLWFTWEPSTSSAGAPPRHTATLRRPAPLTARQRSRRVLGPRSHPRALESFRGRCRPSCKIVLALLQPPRAEPSTPTSGSSRCAKRGTWTASHSSCSRPSGPTVTPGSRRPTPEDSTTRCSSAPRSITRTSPAATRRRSRLRHGARQQPQLLARAHFKRAYYSEFRRGGTIPTRPTPPLQGCRRAPVALTPPDSVHARRT